MHAAIVWAIAAVTIVLMLARPLRLGEWVWPALGALVLVAAGLISSRQAAAAARDGLDVYAFLVGMLALAELARVHGVFDRITAALSARAQGNSRRLFSWLFLIAVGVTALLSNDGTILLLTPAAIALARSARLAALPFAYAVAFVANAGSFVLPISNPANLVVFSPLPQLVPWLALFALPSAAALAVTYAVLRWYCRAQIRNRYDAQSERAPLSSTGRFTLIVVSVALAILVAAAAFGWPVGYVAFALGAVCTIVVCVREPRTLAPLAREAPWSVIPLVAGLFVIVRALDATGALELARTLFRHASAMPAVFGRLYAGGAVTVGDALINNLPAGVVVRYALRGHGISPHIAHAALVGIDLGPNLSISGSLATLLWVMMLRREGIEVNAWRFLALGALVTIPSLALSLAVVR
jgi:arsenical pump membrane protein